MEDFFPLITFLKDYSLSTVVIAVLVAVLKIVLDKYLGKKLPKIVFTLIPFAFAVTLAVAVDMAFYCKAFNLRIDAIYSGLFSASIGVAFCSIINRIKNGQSVSVKTIDLVIEGILEGYVKTDMKALAVSTIVEILTDTTNLVNDNFNLDADGKLVKDIVKVIKEYSLDGFDDNELIAVSHLIVQAFNSIEKENT